MMPDRAEVLGNWTAQEQRDLNRAVARLDGYVLESAGEVLAWSSAYWSRPADRAFRSLAIRSR